MPDTIVVKIGGSTLGAYDTTLEDVVALQRRGLRPVVVHGGGGALRAGVGVAGGGPPVSRGGGAAVGLSGADGGLLKARQLDEKLGFVGEVAEVDTRLLLDLLDDGFLPVLAPIGVEWRRGRRR